MTRGPGASRRFSGQTFGLAEVFRQGALAESMNYEQRQKEASYRAKLLRQSGANARIVNGSGWTAIYVAFRPTFGEVIPSLPAPVKSPTTTKPPKGKKRKSTIAKTVEGMNWNQLLGTKPEPKLKPKEPIITSQDTDRTSAIVFSKLLQKQGPRFPLEQGLGVFRSVEPLTINDVREVEGQELVELLETIPVQFSQIAFKSWLESTAKVGDKRYQNTARLLNLAKVMNGNVEPSVSNLEGVRLYVVFADDQPAYFSFSDGKFATQMKNSAKKSAKAQVKKGDKKEFRGWELFDPSGGMMGGF
jgi:hypothetical protein